MGGFIVGVTRDLSSASEGTFDKILEFNADSLEHVDVVESIVRAILDCAWNCWIEAGGFLYI